MSTPPATPPCAPSPPLIHESTSDPQQVTALSEDEYDRFFDDDEAFNLHDEAAAASDLNDDQSGTGRTGTRTLVASSSGNNRHSHTTRAPDSHAAAEATRPVAPTIRTSAEGSTRGRSGTTTSRSSGAPSNIQTTAVSAGSLARREAIYRAFEENRAADNAAPQGPVRAPTTPRRDPPPSPVRAPTTPRRDPPLSPAPTTPRRDATPRRGPTPHPLPTTPTRRTTATDPTSPATNLSRAQIIENAIRASLAPPATPPNTQTAPSDNGPQSPSSGFGIMTWPAHPDMSFSLSVNNHDRGGVAVASTSGSTPMSSPSKASTSSSSSSPTKPSSSSGKGWIVPRGSAGNPRIFTRSNYNFYAVARGRTIGIFLTWEEAEAQIRGYSDPKFQGFMDLPDAEAYMNRHAPRRY